MVTSARGMGQGQRLDLVDCGECTSLASYVHAPRPCSGCGGVGVLAAPSGRPLTDGERETYATHAAGVMASARRRSK